MGDQYMTISKRTVRDVDMKGKRVLMRVDFNVPLDDMGVGFGEDARVRTTRFSESEIVYAVKQLEMGIPAKQVATQEGSRV